MRFTAILAAFVVVTIHAFVVHAPAAGAEDGRFTIRDCAGLVDWAAQLEAKQPYFLTPRIKVQNVFSPEISAPVFGVPTSRWTPDQAGELRTAKKACAKEMRKAKKSEEQRTLNRINVRVVQTRLKGIAKHRTTVSEISEQLLASPASPALRAVLAAMEPPRHQPGRTIRQVKDAELRQSLTGLSRSLPQIPADEAAAVLAALMAHQEGAAQDRLDELQGEIEAVPATAEGVFQIAGLRLDARELAGLDGQERLSEIERLADERTQAIVEALDQGSAAAPIRLPACLALADWAVGLDLRDAEAYGTGWVYALMKDDSLVPVFGKSLADWTEADFGLFDRSRDICQAQARAAPKDSELGRKVAEGVRALLQVSRILRPNQATFVAYTQATAVLEAQRAEIEALPVAPESLARLDTLMAEPALKQLPQRQYTAHLQAIQAKRQELRIGIRRQDAQMVLGKIADLPVVTQSLADLAGLRMQLLGLVNTPEEQTTYEQAVAERRAELGAGLLDAATAKLDQYDATVEGLTSVQSEHRAIVQQLRGVVAEGAMQSYVAAYEAALARIADGALADYRDYLADLPDSQDGLDALEQSRYDILGPRAPLAALKPYVEALDTRHGEIYAVVSAERLEFARAEIAKIPATAEGLAILAEADREIDGWDIPDAEKATVLGYVDARRSEIGAALLAQPLADLDDFDETIDDLKAMPAFARDVADRYGPGLGHEALMPFFDAYQAKREAVAEAVLPDWQDKLSDLPDEPASLTIIESDLREIEALGDGTTPALRSFVVAGEARAVAIMQEISLLECEPIWSATGMDEDDARLDVLTHDGTTKLGLLACGLAEAGAKLADFDGGSTVELELTTRDGIFVTTSLHEGKVGPEETALVGFAVEDANGERELTVAEWQAWLSAQLFTGSERALLAQKATCETLMAKPEEEITFADLLILSSCVSGTFLQD